MIRTLQFRVTLATVCLIAAAIRGQTSADSAEMPAAELPVFATQFEATGALKAIQPIARANNMSLLPDPAQASNKVLGITVKEGGHYGGSFHVRLGELMGEEPTSIYFRYRLWLDGSWAPEHTGKLPGFNGTYQRAGWGGKPSDGTNGWSARGMFGPLDDDGRTPIGSYIYHADMVEDGRTYGVGKWWDARLERERWYTIEQQIQLDSIGEDGGQGDGRLRAWIDGELVFDDRRLHVRDTDELRIESIWANVYYGGKTPAPSTMSLLIDDLWVDTTRIETTRSE